MTAASSFPHASSPAVHSHEPGHHLTTALAGAFVSVLRRLPARAFGVTHSVWAFVVPAEGALLRASRLPRLERLALQGWPLLSGSLFFRAGLRLQAVSARVSVCLFPILMTGCR